MVFDWNQYPADTGINNTTGQPNVDPSQLQLQPDPTAGNIRNPSFTFDPSQTAPSSPLNPANGGTGGINPGEGFTPTGQQLPPAAGYGASASDPQAYFNQLFPGDTLTPDMLTQNEAALKAQGITLVRNAAGVPGKIKLPDGSVVDVIQGAGSGLNKKQWLTGGGDSGSGMGTLNQFGQGMGFMTAPIGQFTPPTAADAMNSPGTQYALDEAQRTMQNSAAARGTLLNGRTLQGENNALMNMAAGQYQDVYNRAANTYGINYNTQTGNQDRPFTKYTTLADLGQRAASAS